MALTKAVGRVTPTFSPTQTGTSDSSSVPIPTKVTLNSSVTKPTTAAPIRISQVRYRTMGGRALCIRDVMNSLLSTADKLQQQTVLPRRSASGFAKADALARPAHLRHPGWPAGTIRGPDAETDSRGVEASSAWLPGSLRPGMTAERTSE
ncbi:hypothetical protein D3C87_1300460 [compost metagenome]